MLSLIELLAGSNLTEFTVNLSTIFYTNKYKRIYKIENMKGGQPYFMQNTKYKRYNLKKKNLVNPSISFYTKIQNIKLQSFQWTCSIRWPQCLQTSPYCSPSSTQSLASETKMKKQIIWLNLGMPPIFFKNCFSPYTLNLWQSKTLPPC